MKVFENFTRKTKKHYLDYCIQNIKVDGHILEFGVYKGESINWIGSFIPDKTIYGFDTFTGLPEEWQFGNDNHSVGFYSVGVLPKVLSNVVLVEGMFQDTLEPWLEDHSGNISFLHIDSDLYSSAKFVLDTLNARIVEGTIILFDEYKDWGSGRYLNWEEHEYKACQEWLLQYDRELNLIARSDHVQAAFEVVK